MVADELPIDVLQNSEILAVSDIHLTSHSSQVDSWTTHQLAKAVQKLTGPSLVILNGDILDLWRPGESIEYVVRRHKDFFATLKHYASQQQHTLVYVVGNHDGRLAWDEDAQKIIINAFGAKLCLAAELNIEGKKLRVVHGNQFDPDNAFNDPRDPYDTPFGQHVVQDVLPIVKKFNLSITQGIDYLSEPHAYTELLFARLFYRIFLPVMLTVGGTFVLALMWLTTQSKTIDITNFVGWFALIDSAIIFVAGVVVASTIASKLNHQATGGDLAKHNSSPKVEAKKVVSHGGLGLVSGHTHVAELSEVQQGLYANSGFCDQSLARYQVRLGLPDTFLAIKHLSWVHITCSRSKVEVELVEAMLPVKLVSLSAKLFCKNLDFHELKTTERLILKV